MNETETGRLLLMIAAIDPKMPQPDDRGFMRALWARMLSEVPFDAASKAMQDYYSSERYLVKRETISPADVIQWWNARRRPTQREQAGTAPVRALPRPAFDPQRLRDGVDQVMAVLLGKGEGDGAEQAAARRSARSVTCPHCGATVDSPCVRSSRAEPRAEMRNHHPARVEAAKANPEAS